MTINEHITEFAGLPIAQWRADAPVPADPAAVAWRVAVDFDDGAEMFRLRLAALLAQEWSDQVRALVIGEWGEAYDNGPPVDQLIAAAPRLPSLEALFLGELTFEESEISWIQQTDVTPLLEAYPRLEVLTVRGAEGLDLRSIRHTRLRELTFQAGGLPARVVRAVGECDLPALTHLELWLGTGNYGGDATVDDLAGVLTGARLPALKSLGLRDSEIADRVAAALAGAPVVARLERLDLSLGILADPGASALLAGQPLTHLRELDLHHHFISEPLMERIEAELGEVGVRVDLGGAGDPESDDRFVEVSE